MTYKISFQQIDSFLTVAEMLNFTDAARILYLSQPALSKQISLMERELGVPLFVRDRRHVTLTPEGESLYQDWSALSKSMEESVYRARALHSETGGRLSIGCSDTFDYSDVLPGVLRSFRDAYPLIDVNIESHSFKTLRDELMSGALDVIFTPVFELDGLTDVHWMRLKEIPLSIIIPKSNPLSMQETVTLRELTNEAFILISAQESVGGSERTQALLRRCGFSRKNVRYVPNVASMELAVKNGLGVAICNAKIFEGDNATCKIYPLDVEMNDSYLIAVWKRNKGSIALELFCKMLQKHFSHVIH